MKGGVGGERRQLHAASLPPPPHMLCALLRNEGAALSRENRGQHPPIPTNNFPQLPATGFPSARGRLCPTTCLQPPLGPLPAHLHHPTFPLSPAKGLPICVWVDGEFEPPIPRVDR